MDLLLTTSGRQSHLLELHHVGVNGHCKDPREALAKPRESWFQPPAWCQFIEAPHFAAWFPREVYQRIRQIMESVLNIAADVPQSQRCGSFETMRHWSVSAAASDIVVPVAISPASSGNSYIHLVEHLFAFQVLSGTDCFK
jgi:hypothetical protein